MSSTMPDSIPSAARCPVSRWIPQGNHRRSVLVILEGYLDSGRMIGLDRFPPLESPAEPRNEREALSGRWSLPGERHHSSNALFDPWNGSTWILLGSTRIADTTDSNVSTRFAEYPPKLDRGRPRSLAITRRRAGDRK